jgi:PAS domain-containing protein
LQGAQLVDPEELSRGLRPGLPPADPTTEARQIEAEGLHTRPVEHERRSEAAAAAAGLDFGRGFLDTVRERSGPTTKAVTLDASHAAEMVPDGARARLGPVSRMMLPVLEKGRIVVVFVAEWIDLAKRWTDEDVLFAERVVARAAVARERILQYEAIAEQAAHARASQEQVEEALGQLQAVLSALPEAVVGLDDEGKVTFANPAAARLLGRREFELMGRYMTEVTTELEADVETWERVMSADSTRRFPAALAPGDGRRTIDLTVVPGLPSGVCDRLVTLTEHAGPAVVSSNGDGGEGLVVREIAEPLGRLLGNLELLAGGAYGQLSDGQEEALEGARRLGADLRAHIDDVLRGKH